ncbi:hypothetical protein [Solimicrobium silvestre]|uniref:Uncharacterized protein n=1 Tax=Solimicrobium silvestre TaxID=2099400 RepID=A0A2S9H3A5_9BURK|nr:hypothetical protein [Solimicrobium silvestre]PRC94462.1 hypothetical protein S2091_1083 [Solimicrobium silvestre]
MPNLTHLLIAYPALTVLLAGPMALPGTVITAPACVFTVLPVPFTVMVEPLEVMIVPDGTKTELFAGIVYELPAVSDDGAEVAELGLEPPPQADKVATKQSAKNVRRLFCML